MTLSFDRVTVKHGKFTALKEVSATIADTPGITGLIGPNGAGKTTFIETALGFRPVTAGSVHCSHKRMAYCQDTPEFEAGLNALEIVKDSRYQAGLSAVGDEYIIDLLSEVGLSEDHNRRANTFSRGMKQRLGVATGLVLNPDLLFLDEPTSALDPFGRRDLLALIANLSRNIRVIVSTHLLEDVGEIADDIIVMNAGQVVYEGSKADFLSANTGDWQINCSDMADFKDFAEFLESRKIPFRPNPNNSLGVEIDSSDVRTLMRSLDEAPLETISSMGPSSTDMYSSFELAVGNQNV